MAVLFWHVWNQVERGRRWLLMKPDCSTLAIVLKLVGGLLDRDTQIEESDGLGPSQSTQRLPHSVFHYPSALSSIFKTPLSAAAWSEVWPYSYVTCRTCAIPAPAYSHQLILFFIYGRHSPFKAVPPFHF